MSSLTLPIILVSAYDKETASRIITELIDNEVEDNKYKELGWRVWRLVNKYYTALVRAQPLSDGVEVSDIEAEAHVIYLTENEDVELAEARRVRAANVVRHGAVRLALVESAEITESLISWGLRARYEVVALRGEEGEDGEGEEEEGPGRARAALHAHVWPALRHRISLAIADDEYESSDGGSEEGGESGEEEERAVERAEAFAEALDVLASLSSERGGGGGGGGGRLEEHDGLRRERAEQLVAAFCRALGHHLDAC